MGTIGNAKRVLQASLVPAAIALIILVVASPAGAQSENTDGVVTRVDQLEAQVESLSSSVDALQRSVYFVGGLIGVLGLGGFIFSAFQGFRQEQRAKESHGLALQSFRAAEERAAESHSLTVGQFGFMATSERSAESRADSAFKQSVETVQLVNDTLGLAQRATQQALEYQTRRVESEVRTVKGKIDKLLADVSYGGDPKALVTDRVFGVELKRLDSQAAGLLPQLTIHDIDVPGEFSFVRGLYWHLEEDSEQAIDEWEQAKLAAAEAENRIVATLSDYWIAYECNILGRDIRAAQIFDQLATESHDTDSESYFRQHALESRFFHLGSGDSGSPMDCDSDALRAFANDLDDRVERAPSPDLLLLRGNVNLWLARAAGGGDVTVRLGNSAYMAKASESFGEAVGLWAEVGQLDVQYQLGAHQPEAATRVADALMEQYHTRREPRSKALLAATALICLDRERQATAVSLEAYRESVGDVPESVRLFSPFWKVNVAQERFIEDIKAFVSRDLEE
jgi:outer membrane murein-binding lipoprotein Lpp